MSTLCPYRIIKGDDGLSVKVEWDVHYLTDEQIGIVRKYVAEIEAENEKLRELVRELFDYVCDSEPSCFGCRYHDEDDECELKGRTDELGVEV